MERVAGDPVGVEDERAVEGRRRQLRELVDVRGRGLPVLGGEAAGVKGLGDRRGGVEERPGLGGVGTEDPEEPEPGVGRRVAADEATGDGHEEAGAEADRRPRLLAEREDLGPSAAARRVGDQPLAGVGLGERQGLLALDGQGAGQELARALEVASAGREETRGRDPGGADRLALADPAEELGRRRGIVGVTAEQGEGAREGGTALRIRGPGGGVVGEVGGAAPAAEGDSDAPGEGPAEGVAERDEEEEEERGEGDEDEREADDEVGVALDHALQPGDEERAQARADEHHEERDMGLSEPAASRLGAGALEPVHGPRRRSSRSREALRATGEEAPPRRRSLDGRGRGRAVAAALHRRPQPKRAKASVKAGWARGDSLAPASPR